MKRTGSAEFCDHRICVDEKALYPHPGRTVGTNMRGEFSLPKEFATLCFNPPLTASRDVKVQLQVRYKDFDQLHQSWKTIDAVSTVDGVKRRAAAKIRRDRQRALLHQPNPSAPPPPAATDLIGPEHIIPLTSCDARVCLVKKARHAGHALILKGLIKQLGGSFLAWWIEVIRVVS